MSNGSDARRRATRRTGMIPRRAIWLGTLLFGIAGFAISGCSSCVDHDEQDLSCEVGTWPNCGESDSSDGGLQIDASGGADASADAANRDAGDLGDASSSCRPGECGPGEVCSEGSCYDVCSEQSDCKSGLLCGEARHCIPEPGPDGCSSDADCLSRSCTDGTCEPATKCDDNSDCSRGSFCSPQGVCVSECSVDLECSAAESCVDGRCVVSGTCSSDADCGGNASCVDGSCRIGCSSDADCGRDALCFRGTCSFGCSSDSDCANGVCWRQVCVPESSKQPGEPAPRGGSGDGSAFDAGLQDGGTTDTSGGSGMPDRNQAPSCRVNSDCSTGEICEDGRCVADGICTSHSECSPGSYCHRGQCRVGCTSDAHCRKGESCTSDGRCAPTDSGGVIEPGNCSSSSDCEPCEVCVSGTCEVVPRVCVTDSQCGIGKECLDGICHYECSGDADCPKGQACDGGTCRSAPPQSTSCTSNSDCTDGSCINGRCFDHCQSDSDCGGKLMCDHGVCQPDYRPGPQCMPPQVQCPQNTSCVNGYCTVRCRDDSQCRSGNCKLGYCTR